MQGGASRSAVAIIAVSVLLLLIGVVARWRSSETPPPPRQPSTAPAAGPVPPPRAAEDAPPLASTASRPRAERDDKPDGDPFADDEASHGTWEALDLEAVRKALPENVYWKMAAPTKDPDLLRWREEERARWNVEYGKVLSNTATAEEIDAYFAERKRLSDDYLEFVVHVLTNYGGAIPREGVALLKLAGEMHAARLEELPRQQAEAQARREKHDAARRAWLEEQKTFGAPPSETR
jgi:hypothetical protein